MKNYGFSCIKMAFVDEGRRMKYEVLYTDDTKISAATFQELLNRINTKHGDRVLTKHQLTTLLNDKMLISDATKLLLKLLAIVKVYRI